MRCEGFFYQPKLVNWQNMYKKDKLFLFLGGGFQIAKLNWFRSRFVISGMNDQPHVKNER